MSNKTFCVHPWVRHFVNTQGSAELCCEADRSHSDDNITTDWHAPHLQQARATWNQGQWPSQCHRCQHIESQGGRSLRQIVNNQYETEYEFFRRFQTVRPPSPVAYDLRLSNRCNLQCVMCNPHSSDSIARAYSEWLNQPPIEPPSADHTNSLIDMICDHSKHCEHIQLAGGEPFVMPGVPELLTRLCDSGHSEHIDLEVTTNGTVLRPQWCDQWFARFKSCHISVSVDAVGDRNEYVRWGHRWHTLTRRIGAMISEFDSLDHCRVTVGATVHAATVSQIPPLWQWCQDQGIQCDFTCVTDPTWLRPERAPRKLRDQVCDWIDSLTDDQQIHSNLKPTVWNCLRATHTDTVDDQLSQTEYIRYLNATRPMTWRQAVPELADWDPDGEPPLQ